MNGKGNNTPAQTEFFVTGTEKPRYRTRTNESHELSLRHVDLNGTRSSPKAEELQHRDDEDDDQKEPDRVEDPRSFHLRRFDCF